MVNLPNFAASWESSIVIFVNSLHFGSHAFIPHARILRKTCLFVEHWKNSLPHHRIGTVSRHSRHLSVVTLARIGWSSLPSFLSHRVGMSSRAGMSCISGMPGILSMDGVIGKPKMLVMRWVHRMCRRLRDGRPQMLVMRGVRRMSHRLSRGRLQILEMQGVLHMSAVAEGCSRYS